MDKLLAIAVSGIRPGEDARVKELIAQCDLHTEDITAEMLRHYIVARKGNRILGVVGLEAVGKACLLRSLAVDQAYRNQKIATKLMTSIEKYAKMMGVEVLYLLTMTAEEFFLKSGYERTDRQSAPAEIKATAEFKSLCPDTAACFCKKIAS
jgi:amino-acid N-acetyltransferase